MQQNKPLISTFVFFLILLVAACDPLGSQPTPAVIIVTAIPSATPLPTLTPPATATPIPTLTPVILPSPTSPPCDEPAGQLIRIDQFASQIAGENLRYRVYIPPCYQKSVKRYPYVILLHGSGQKEDEWEKLGVIESADQGFSIGILPPMIIVMPYFGSIGNNPFFPPAPSYEAVILEELIPAIDRDFCTWSNRDHRAIGGLSRGGFWAFSIGMRHSDVFGILGGHSAYMTQDLNEVPADFNPLDMAQNLTSLPDAKLRMYIDNGAQDPSGLDLELFSTRLSERGIAHTYVINPVGKHDEDYWSAHVSEYLAFYGRNWPRSASALPDCAEPSP